MERPCWASGASEPPPPPHEGWGGGESLGPGRGAAARQARARPTRRVGVWVPALSALAVELGKPSLLGKFRQLPTHAAGGVLAGARGAARHRPAARGPGPPSPLVYPRPASGCHWGMEGKQGTPLLLLLSVRARSPTGDLLTAPHSSTKGPLGGAPLTCPPWTPALAMTRGSDFLSLSLGVLPRETGTVATCSGGCRRPSVPGPGRGQDPWGAPFSPRPVLPIPRRATGASA